MNKVRTTKGRPTAILCMRSLHPRSHEWGESSPSSIAQWLPSEWGSKRAWLESAHRAARVLRRDVAQAKPEQIRQAIELASRLNPGPWGGEFHERLEPTWRGAEVTWKEHDEGR